MKVDATKIPICGLVNLYIYTSGQVLILFKSSTRYFIIVNIYFRQAVCESCENLIEGAPVRLPCSHVICRKCLFDCLTLKEFECPKCHQQFPKDLNPDDSKQM